MKIKDRKSGTSTSCIKCGMSDLYISWHAASEEPKNYTCGEHRSCMDKFPTDKREHLHVICRTCQYEWIEPTKDAQREDFSDRP